MVGVFFWFIWDRYANIQDASKNTPKTLTMKKVNKQCLLHTPAQLESLKKLDKL